MEARNDPVTVYCLGLIAEEAGEVVQVVGQAQRFGLDTPKRVPAIQLLSAREKLAREIGDVLAAAHFASLHGLVDLDDVHRFGMAKLTKLLDAERRDELGRPLAPPPAYRGDRLDGSTMRGGR